MRAMEIIDELEREKRGPYAGCIGYFGARGEMDTCIVLRTAVVKDGQMHVQAGAGIVYDSDPASEQQECVNKAKALFPRRRGGGAVRRAGETGAVGGAANRFRARPDCRTTGMVDRADASGHIACMPERAAAMPNVLVIDNYDSFTWNLVHLIGPLCGTVDVVRNDALTIPDIRARAPDAIVLSPGPCTPTEAGICLDVVRDLSEEIPIFGVCLGLQAIGQAFGGDVVRAPLPLHGKVSTIRHAPAACSAA